MKRTGMQYSGYYDFEIGIVPYCFTYNRLVSY